MTSSTAVVLSVVLSFVAVAMLSLCFGLGLFTENYPPVRSEVSDFATIWFACIFGIGKFLYIANHQFDEARHLNRVAASITLFYGWGMGFYCWNEVIGLLRGEHMNNREVFFAWYAILAVSILTLGFLWKFLRAWLKRTAVEDGQNPQV